MNPDWDPLTAVVVWRPQQSNPPGEISGEVEAPHDGPSPTHVTAGVTDPHSHVALPRFIINARFLRLLLNPNPPGAIFPGPLDILIEASDDESTHSHASDSIDTEMTFIDETFDVETQATHASIPNSPDIPTTGPPEQVIHSPELEPHGPNSLDTILTSPAEPTPSRHSHPQGTIPNSPDFPDLPPQDTSRQHSPSPPLQGISPLKFSRVPRVKIAPLKRKNTEPEQEDVFGTNQASKPVKTGFMAPVKKDSVETVHENEDTIMVNSGGKPREAGMEVQDMGSLPEGRNAGSEKKGGMGGEGLESSEGREGRDERDAEQWKVGRLPGHQGSHTRSPRAADTGANSGLKRSLSQGISDSAERVLKKPFRPPRPAPKLHLQLKPKSSSSSHPHSHSPGLTSPTLASTLTLTPRSSSSSLRKSAPSRVSRTPFPSGPNIVAGPTPQTPDFPLFKTHIPRVTNSLARQKLSKPFKTPTSSKSTSPFARSAAPSPYSIPTKPGNTNTNINTKMTELEKTIRTLKQAVRYLNEPEEDERLEQLISTWRQAGRTVADLLFPKFPKPEDNKGTDHYKTHPYHVSSSWEAPKPWGQPGEGWDDLTEEQKRYLIDADTNERGEMVDNDGNPIFQLEMDLDKFIEANCDPAEEDQKDRPYVPMDWDRRTGSSSEIAKLPAPVNIAPWNIGAMMLKLGVDPDLLGWDNDAEDWAEVED